MTDSVVVEVRRGSLVESRHEVDVALLGGPGRLERAWGDIDRLTYARSSLKPVQAMPLLTTGARDRFGLGGDELALAAASHRGESRHVVVIDRWLERIGVHPHRLECGVHAPLDPEAAADLIRSAAEPDERHHNCSGKHAAMLSVAIACDLDTRGYIDPDHAVQRQHVTPAIEDACRVQLTDSQRRPAIDGCGVPVWPLTLRELTEGWANLARRGAGREIFEAMAARPDLVAGSAGTCTELMCAAGGAAVAKTGAEGVYCGVDLTSGASFALKARDGATRASEAVARWLFDRWGFLDHQSTPLYNARGIEVGSVRVVNTP